MVQGPLATQDPFLEASGRGVNDIGEGGELWDLMLLGITMALACVAKHAWPGLL